MDSKPDALWDRYRSAVDGGPDRKAIVEDGGRVTSHRQLAARAERAAAGLLGAGLTPGDVLGVFLPNRPSWVVATLAGARAGVGTLGLNTRFRTAELDHLLGVAQVDTVLVVDRFLGVEGPSIMGGVSRPLRLLIDGEDPDGPGGLPTPTGATSWSVVEAGSGPIARAPSPQDPTIGFTTSGTTGFPKIAMHTSAQTVAHLGAVIDRFGFDRTTVSLVPLPLCGAFGYTTAMATLLAGGQVVLQQAWDPDRAAAAIARHGVTFFAASDDMLLAVEASPAFDQATTWRTGGFADFTNAGAEAVRRLDDRTGGATRLAGLYGSSEGFALMATFDHDAPVAERVANGGHLVGRSMEVRACDPETGAVLDHHQPGELQFRGPNLISGYLNAPEATVAAFTPDGWYRSGDLGHTVESDGAGRAGFVFLARMGDALRLRGFLCDPSEIEAHLERHPSVSLAQVVGVTRPDIGDVAVAFVLPADETGGTVEEADLLEHCRAGLANYKRPERIVAVDEFPVTEGPNGVKIRKVDLRDQALALLGGDP